jgi:hypothetical protein
LNIVFFLVPCGVSNAIGAALLEDGERDIRVGTSTDCIDKDQTKFEARIGQRIHQESTGLSRR